MTEIADIERSMELLRIRCHEEIDALAERVSGETVRLGGEGWVIETYRVLHNWLFPVAFAVGEKNGTYALFVFHDGELEDIPEGEPYFTSEKLDEVLAVRDVGIASHASMTNGDGGAGKEAAMRNVEDLIIDERVLSGLTVCGGR